MRTWGTPAVASHWPMLPSAAATADGRPHLPRTAMLEAGELVPVLKLTLAEIDKRIARLEAREQRLGAAPPPDNADDCEDDGDDGDRGLRDGGRRRGRGGGSGDAPRAKRRRAADMANASVLSAAQAKITAHAGDVAAAAAGQTRAHLTLPELKELLRWKGWGFGGKTSKADLLAHYMARSGGGGDGGGDGGGGGGSGGGDEGGGGEGGGDAAMADEDGVDEMDDEREEGWEEEWEEESEEDMAEEDDEAGDDDESSDDDSDPEDDD